MRKRLLSFILLLLLLVPALSACLSADTGGEQTTPAPGESVADGESVTSDDKLVPNIPEGTNYGGYKFVIANSFYTETKYTTNAIDPGVYTGNDIDDAIYTRTLKVESLLGVDIVDSNYTVDQMKKELLAGDIAFDLMTVNLSNVRGFINLGVVMDFYDLDGIDLDMPWWDKNAQEKLSVAGKLFYTLSDFLITGIDNSRAVFFNKEMCKNLGLENPYELVGKNEWTLDKMREMGMAAVSDNGDGVTTRDDTFGMLCWNATSFYEVYLTGSDAEIMKQGDNNIPYFYCFEDRFIEVYTKLLDVFSKDNMTLLENDVNIFMSGHALFTTWTLAIAKTIRAMDTDFGIVPVPKYDAMQESYWHVSPNPHAMMVPLQAKEPTRTGIILEALSYYSSSSYSDDAVIPTYFELAIKSRTTRDVESLAMLDIVKNSISYVIKLDDTGMTSSIYSYFGSNNYNIASLLKGSKKAALLSLEKVFKAMGVETG